MSSMASWASEPRTTDAQRGNSIHCTAGNPNPKFLGTYDRSIFCLPYRPNFSDIFDLCLHWVSVVRDQNQSTRAAAVIVRCYFLFEVSWSLVIETYVKMGYWDLRTDQKWKLLRNDCFTTLAGHFLPYVSLSIEVQTVSLRCLTDLNLMAYFFCELPKVMRNLRLHFRP